MIEDSKRNQVILEGGDKAKLLGWIDKNFPFGKTGCVEDDCVLLVLHEIFGSFASEDREHLVSDFITQLQFLEVRIERAASRIAQEML